MALLSGGGQAEYVTVPEGHLMPVPKDMTFIQAAAIPEAWLTAFQLLHFVGKIQKGETVLIHAGASGVGMAAARIKVTHHGQEPCTPKLLLQATAGRSNRWKVLRLET